MLIKIIFFLLVIIILTYYYYHYLKNHFWYHFGKNLGKPKFYSGKLHPNIYSKKNLIEKDKMGLVQLYANYMQGIIIDKEKIEYFISTMPYPEIFYMKVNLIYYGAVMNSIIEIKYKNKTYLSNFVDNAIINKNHRDKGIFKELMNYISNYSNEMNAKFIIFKIDKKPIPSFYEYNLTSNYYYMQCPFKKGAYPQNASPQNASPQNASLRNESSNNTSPQNASSQNIIILTYSFKSKEVYNFYKETDNLGICQFFKADGSWENGEENFGVCPFFKEEFINQTIMIFKRNSPDSIELLYIYKPIKQNIQNIIEYLQNNYSYKILLVDDIGNNSHLIKAYPELFKIAYPVYHYILGFKEKIAKENFFYYF